MSIFFYGYLIVMSSCIADLWLILTAGKRCCSHCGNTTTIFLAIIEDTNLCTHHKLHINMSLFMSTDTLQTLSWWIFFNPPGNEVTFAIPSLVLRNIIIGK